MPTPSPSPGAMPPRALLWLVLLTAGLGWVAWQANPAPGLAPTATLAPPAEPEWIWAPGPTRADRTLHLAVRFELDAPARLLGGAFTADNAFDLWLDGELLTSGDEWTTPVPLAEGGELAAGSHVLAVRAWNEGGPAGLLGRLVVGERAVVTDGSWRVWDAAPAGWPGAGLADLLAGLEGEEGSGAVSAPAADGPAGLAGVPARSFGTASDHTGPWGPVLAPRAAPDPADFLLTEGFVCERLYSARAEDGSWASMTWTDDGRLVVSPERGSLLVFEPGDPLLAGAAATPRVAPLGGGSHAAELGDPRSLAHLPVHAAQGLEWAHDALYVSVSAGLDDGGGLWRLTSTDGDGRLDAAERLVAYAPYSEHGAHGLRLLPDGDLVLVQGNFATGPRQVEGRPPLELDLTPTAHIEEDVLLPRIWDPRGHAHDVLAPGGELWRFDPDGVRWTRVAAGMRNAYDVAVSSAGEVFTYDSDMEWDHGTPWYRSPAVYHLVPGADFGWRSGTSKWPRQYPDTLPVVCETDLASPTGLELGEAGRFGEPWDQALFLGDWSWGRILAVHLEPHGASYRGEPEVFLEGRGVTITDLEFGPDGNLWFTTGGRGTQSGLYRVRLADPWGVRSGRLAVGTGHAERQALEAGAEGLGVALGYDLDGQDPFAVAAAETWLRRTPPETWEAALSDWRERDRAWQEAFAEAGAIPPVPPVTRADLRLALALVQAWPDHAAGALPGLLDLDLDLLTAAGRGGARTPWSTHEDPGPGDGGLVEVAPDGDPAPMVLADELAPLVDDVLLGLRLAMLLELRLPELAAAHHAAWTRDLVDALATPPAVTDGGTLIERERARLAVALGAPGLPGLLVPRTAAPWPQEHRLHMLLVLRLVDDGWTPALRQAYLAALSEARAFQGGASLDGFVRAIETAALAGVPEAERAELEAYVASLAASRAAAPDPLAGLPRLAKVRSWTTADAVAAVDAAPPGDPDRGRTQFTRVGCAACHRIDGAGGALGPDLTAAGRRFGRPDLLRAIVEPDAARSDQYELVRMPAGMVDGLTAAELADLVAFLEARR